MLSNGNFWAGIIVGVLAVWAYRKFQARSAS